ncbi:hypothetical protein C9994_14545 [Marivirga lumbricoides]|uniref:DUF4868 domain-containing protein n=1 Tax=Marivirga lumbricoides TaxID=1046115 RepID=A0A2T4DE38_9BACT|nr:hypothetical protein C9994_14545 [Marivirga lumbricoides]
MPNKQIQTLRQLKNLDLRGVNVTLAVVKEYKRDRVSQYNVKYVPIDQRLENRLRNIVVNHINNSNTVEEYSYDCPEPEEDQVRVISYEETDFYRIFEQLEDLNPEEDIIENVEELVKSKAYMIILRTVEGIKVVGFKTLPENWRMKRSKGLIPLLYTENRFEDLEQNNVFSISSLVDLFYFNEFLFILSKKDFERGLNFREGMINNANELYEEVTQLNIFVNMEILTDRVGNNQRYLRKIATIRNLGHYRNPVYLRRLQQLSAAKGWKIQFEEEQIVITNETLDDILTLLQNKRLHSELTEEDFDVESTKPVSLNE